MNVSFDKLKNADLIVDTIYEGGTEGIGKANEVLSKLILGCSNSSGYRTVKRNDGSGLPAYVVLFTTMSQLPWPMEQTWIAAGTTMTG